MKILIVDDEKNIVDILSYNLKKEGYEIEAAYDGRAGLEAARTCSPDLILLDVMLPYMDGFEVCSEIRKTDRLTPIIMLTAREEERDKVYGLELGADDYITKPFSVRELLARVKTNVRRRSVLVEPAEAGDESVRAGRLTIDVPRQTVAKDGVELDLTQREFELIRFMSRPCGKVFSREELMREVWQYEYYGDVRAVDVAIRRLREKIEDDPAAPAILMTKRGAGYYLEG
ncbi:MAG: response regulator transcription factor [Oscillospiraceae bacterium]|nr:response regulator transcription factor [Oscillospiraceae bacterium]